MNNTSMYLFIGGLADGQRLPVPEGMEHWRYSKAGAELDELRRTVDVAIYRRMPVSGGNEVASVFVLNSLSNDDAMRLFVDNYTSPAIFDETLDSLLEMSNMVLYGAQQGCIMSAYCLTRMKALHVLRQHNKITEDEYQKERSDCELAKKRIYAEAGLKE